MPKIIAINGSPRSGWNTGTLSQGHSTIRKEVSPLEHNENANYYCKYIEQHFL